MKISNILFVMALFLSFTLTSCKGSQSNSGIEEEHGHEHNADGSHKEEVVNQEEFSVNGVVENEEEHGHEHNVDGSHKEEQVEADEQSNEATIIVKANKALV